MRRICFMILSCLLLIIIICNSSYGDENNNNDNDKTDNNNDESTTASSIIVCGVDGMVYIFNAWNGHLRGLFSSGSALVTANQKEDDERTTSSSSNSKQRIVPGLDGHIYTFHSGNSDNDFYYRQDDDDDDNDDIDDDDDDNINLKVLPYSVKELIESPEILCKTFFHKKKSSNPEEENVNNDDCGIVTGSKQSTIFALDILSGSVEWVQQPSSSSSFKLSTTISSNNKHKNAIIIPLYHHQDSNSNSNNKKRNRTARNNNKNKNNPNVLLLQREDYFIHQVNIQEGIEDWNVTVSNFQALDMFPGSKKSKTTTKTSSTANNLLDGNNRQRTSISSSTSISTNYVKDWSQPKKQMILNPSNSRYYQQQKQNHHHEKDYHSFFNSFENNNKRNNDQLFFPSIAFGRDGNSIIAINPSSHEFIWKRQLDTVIAAVHGASRQEGQDKGQWISVSVVDEQDVFYTTQKDNNNNANENEEVVDDDIITSTSSLVKSDDLQNENNLSPFEWDMKDGYPNKKISNNGNNNDDYWIRLLMQQQRQQYQSSLIVNEDEDKSLVAYYHPVSSPSSISKTDSSTTATITSRYPSKNIIKAAKLGIHSSTLFVSSTILQQRQPQITHAPAVPSTTHTEQHHNYVQLQEEEVFLAIPQVYLTDTLTLQQDDYNDFLHSHMNKSFKTPQGLFLTWNMIILLFISLCAGLHVGRMYYKHRFQHTLRMTLFETQSQDLSSLPMPKPHCPKRSHSMSEIENLQTPKRERSSSFPLREEQDDLYKPGASNSCKTLSNLPIPSPATTAPEAAKTTNHDTITTTPVPATKKGSVIRKINGIPFVIQYSRYKSEFQEIHALGKGGFGTVFRVRNVVDGMEYAIKKIYISSQKEELTRVLREVKILALLNHPNIVRYYTAWLEVEEDDETTQNQHTDDEETRDPNNSSFTSSYLENGITGTSFIQRDMEQQLLLSSSVHNERNNSHLSSDSYSENSSYISTGYTNSFHTNRGFSSNFLVGTNRIDEGEEDDLGFNWDRNSNSAASENRIDDDDNDDTLPLPQNSTTMTTSSKDESSNRSEEHEEKEENQCSYIADSSTNQSTTIESTQRFETTLKTSLEPKQKQQTSQNSTSITKQRHVLYIQMQFCSQNTISDWITSMFSKMKQEPSSSTNNIPEVLKLFSQIINAVNHVHHMGLIHRDLKPSNCFLDEEGVVKIGDFGLSRELYEKENPNNINDIHSQDSSIDQASNKICCDHHQPQDITAGIGTRSYASPEQMNGSDYDASTDIYSLGVLLFELCYPLNTAMEKYLVFNDLRHRIFPAQWNSTIAVTFPSLNSLLYAMLSPNACERPTSAKINDVITNLLNEHTIQSFNHSLNSRRSRSNSLSNSNHNRKTSSYNDNGNRNSDYNEGDNNRESSLLRTEAADEDENDTTKNQEGIVLQRELLRFYQDSINGKG